MGNHVAGALGPPWHDYCIKPLDKAIAVMEEFYDQNLDFGISCADLQVLLPTQPAETCEGIVKRFGCGTDSAVLNALDFVCALICVADGGFEQKMAALHRSYDFERKGELSLDEAILLVVSTLRGVQCLTAFTSGTDPKLAFTANARETEERIETILSKAFAEKNNAITPDDFVEWAGSFLGCPDTPDGKDASHLNVPDILLKFKLCTAAEAEEMKERCDPLYEAAAPAPAAAAEAEEGKDA